MSFRFRLQKVLELRRSQLEELRLRMGQLQSRRQQAQNQLDEAQAQRADYARRCEEPDAQALSPLTLHSRIRTVQLHQQRVQACREAVGVVADEIRQLHGELLEANRRVKILERLREKKLADHVAEIEAQERKMLDDINRRKGGVGSLGSALPARSLR